MSEGATAPASLTGPETFLGMGSVNNFRLGSWDGIVPARRAAISTLYRGLDGVLGEDVPITLQALDTAAAIRAGAGVQNGAQYANNAFANTLKDLASILRAEVGMQVATVDVGGWDTHTDEANDLDNNLKSFAQALAAFMTDLGPERRKRVTVVVQTEFGRRVATNGTGGSDHGHGSTMMLLGGGLAGSGVYGVWLPLVASVLDDGDVPGLNSPFAVLAEVAQKRMGVGLLNNLFPGQLTLPLGIAKYRLILGWARMAQLRGSVAITHGRVVPVDGPVVEDGTVLVEDGVITAVGPDVAIPDGTTEFDASGRWVLPGFVEAHGHVGIDEEGLGWAGDDTNEMTDPNGARMRALDAINPADIGFHDALAGGVTAVVVKPGSGNPIGGQTVAIKTWGRIVDEMVLKAPASVKSALGENPKRVYGDRKQLPVDPAGRRRRHPRRA